MGFWVATSLWGYPIVLTLHTLGMGTLVGISLMLCLRVLGLINNAVSTNMQTYWKVALVGFALNLFSGSALFFGSATSLWESWPFRIKLILIATGLLLTHKVANMPFQPRIKTLDKFIAAVTIVTWLAALTAGRLIAYID